MSSAPASRNRRSLALERDLAETLQVSRSARPRQVADAVLELVGAHDRDDDRIATAGATWLRHLVELIGEHEWRAGDVSQLAERVAADAVSDTVDTDVEGALRIVTPSERATGPAARTALRRVLPTFCGRLIKALRSIPPIAEND